MAIVNTKYDLHRDGNKCAVCSGHLHFPCFWWRAEVDGAVDIFICGRCCRKIKRGFIADLIQISASMDICDLGYNDARLVCKSSQALEAEGEKEQREIAEVERGIGIVSTPISRVPPRGDEDCHELRH